MRRRTLPNPKWSEIESTLYSQLPSNDMIYWGVARNPSLITENILESVAQPIMALIADQEEGQ